MPYTFKYIEPFPGVSAEDWSSYQWQTKNSLKSQTDFESIFTLTAEEKAGFEGLNKVFQVRVTPYYASLADKSNLQDPIRKILMPNAQELTPGMQQMLDPLGENKHRPADRIIHRYPDRCLFLVTDFCSVYCRYCTRKHFTGKSKAFAKKDEYAEAIQYIKNTNQIKEVILSGGDPLTLSNEKLERVLFDLRQISHVEIIRIGTRMPVVAPMRVDEPFAKMLRKYKPVFLMTHFNHANEITEQSANSIECFVDNGIPVMNQMVLLNGVNNTAEEVEELSRKLLYLRAKPYYMHQCDPSEGTDHLRTSVENSMQIQKSLWGNLSGLAMPNLSLDIPGGGGKVGIVPDFLIEESKDKKVYRGFDGIIGEYINPK